MRFLSDRRMKYLRTIGIVIVLSACSTPLPADSPVSTTQIQVGDQTLTFGNVENGVVVDADQEGVNGDGVIDTDQEAVFALARATCEWRDAGVTWDEQLQSGLDVGIPAESMINVFALAVEAFCPVHRDSLVIWEG